MSLDIALLNNAGYPIQEVKVSTEEHSQLLQQAEKLSLPLLSRLRDYYQDVEYTSQETLYLQDEIIRLTTQCSGDPEFCTLIERLQFLVCQAVKDAKNVVAIAD